MYRPKPIYRSKSMYRSNFNYISTEGLLLWFEDGSLPKRAPQSVLAIVSGTFVLSDAWNQEWKYASSARLQRYAAWKFGIHLLQKSMHRLRMPLVKQKTPRFPEVRTFYVGEKKVAVKLSRKQSKLMFGVLGKGSKITFLTHDTLIWASVFDNLSLVIFVGLWAP